MWACELKSKEVILFFWCVSHAPRERVSWNHITYIFRNFNKSHAPRERVSWNYVCDVCGEVYEKSRSTWACELKWTEYKPTDNGNGSRSTWACELKLWQRSAVCWIQKSRSTWACELKLLLTYTVIYDIMVMLHVSVWVEIQRGYTLFLMCKSRSTWACELKSYHLYFSEFQQKSRSTWACELKSELL